MEDDPEQANLVSRNGKRNGVGGYSGRHTQEKIVGEKTFLLHSMAIKSTLRPNSPASSLLERELIRGIPLTRR